MIDSNTHHSNKITIEVSRGAGHPFTGKGPFDQAMVKNIPTSSLKTISASFKAKFWCIYFQSDEVDGLHDVLFFKPSGYKKLYFENKQKRKMVIQEDYSFLD